MSAAAVAKKPSKTISEDMIRFRAEKAWADRVDLHAQRLGLTRSAYIRLKLTQIMDAEDKERAEHKPKD